MLPKRKREQQIVTGIIGLVFLIVLVGLGMLLITLMFNASSSETTFLPTAAYLEQHPLESPTFMRVNQDCMGDSRHCFRLQIAGLAADNEIAKQLPTLSVRVDGQLVQSNTQIFGSELYADVPVSQLGDGLHLVEIRVADARGNIQQHSWAMRLGSTAGAAVPTVAVPPTNATATP